MGDSAIKKSIDRLGSAFFNYQYNRIKKLSYVQIDRRARFLSKLYYIIDKRRMKIAKSNLKKAFGDKYSNQEINDIVKQMLYNFVVEFYMFFAVDNKPNEEIMNMLDVINLEYVHKASEKGKGVIMLTAHLGNWELPARMLTNFGFTLNVIARDSDHTGITTVTNNIRNNGGYSVYSKDRPLLGIVKALRRGELIAILPDQNNDDGIWVKFFGIPAKTAVGPAVLSLKTGAPIVPIFCKRESLGKYRIEIKPEIDYTPLGDKDKDIENLTQICNDVIEKEIREYPASWLWLHNRWKKNKD